MQMVDQGREAAAWLSQFLEPPLLPLPPLPFRRPRFTLLRAPDESTRDGGLADTHPLLLVCEASLHALNTRRVAAGLPNVPMERFRPNIVVGGGCAAHEEDTWATVSIGSATLRAKGPCPRCPVPDIDQRTGAKDVGAARAMSTLGSYRTVAGRGVLFGAWFSPTRGTLRVGDVVRIHS
jgi:uncharacterized protein YcbX